MVWSCASDGFKQISMFGDGFDSTRLQEEESVMVFYNTKGSGFVGCDMGENYASNKGSLGLEKLLVPNVVVQHEEGLSAK